jgi:hypothetical protein
MSGGGKSKKSSRSQSESASGQFSNTFIDPAQAGFLQMIREQAAGLYPGAQGVGNDMLAQSQQLFGQGQRLLGDLTGATGGVIDQLGGDIARQVQRQIGGAGGVDSNAALAGALGGGRNQVMRALVNEAGLNEFGQQAANLRLGGTTAALQGLPTLLNLGLGGMQAQWAPLQALSAIYGDPTVLSRSEGWERSRGTSRSSGSAWNVSGIGGGE